MRWLLAVLVSASLQASAATIPTVSRGDAIELADHLARGRLTLIDFYADWCAPCRGLAPRLERLAASHADDLAVLKVDIVDWNSSVSRQFGLRSIPHLKLFGRDGRLLAEGAPATVLATLERELGPEGSRSARGATPLVPIAAGALLAIVAAAVVARLARRRPARPSAVRFAEMPPRDDRDDPPVWFVMSDDRLDGPHTRAELARFITERKVDRTARIRRSGSAHWTTVADVLSR